MAVKAALVEREWSIKDWMALPEGPPYYELEEGRLMELPSPRREHQDIVGTLYFVLRQFCREHDLGTVVMEVDVVLPTGRGYIPDLAFISKEREAELLAPDGKIHGVPDLVVEVISPNTQARDRYRKFSVYWMSGVLWYWLVDSETLVIQEFEHTPEGYLCRATVESGEVFSPKLFPGLKIDLNRLLGAAQASKPKRTRKRNPKR